MQYYYYDKISSVYYNLSLSLTQNNLIVMAIKRHQNIYNICTFIIIFTGWVTNYRRKFFGSHLKGIQFCKKNLIEPTNTF